MLPESVKKFKLYKKIVNCKLWMMGSKRYYYWKKYGWPYKLYYNKSKKYYLRRIAKWAYRNNILYGSIQTIMKQLEDVVDGKEVDKKRIAFLVEHISPRTIKMVKAIIQEGFQVEVYISSNININNGLLADIKDICEFCIKYHSTEELMYHLIYSKVFVIHWFTEWLSCAEVNVLLHQSELFPKIVVERYDVITGMYTKELSLCYKDISRQEKYAMENAAGVCFRNFTKEYLEREFQFSYKGACLTFLDYYDKDMEVAVDIEADDTESLSFCYAGSVTTEKRWPGSRNACYLEFAELCKQNKCHFHVYPSIWSEEEYSDYIELENQNSYFHFHHPVEYRKLGKELSKYDYGVGLTRQYKNEDSEKGIYSDGQWIYAVGNKAFDYICFGLPVIQKAQTMLVREFASKEMLIPWHIEQYNFDELRREKRRMKENVLKNRGYYRMDNRIHELIVFYKSL